MKASIYGGHLVGASFDLNHLGSYDFDGVLIDPHSFKYLFSPH